MIYIARTAQAAGARPPAARARSADDINDIHRGTLIVKHIGSIDITALYGQQAHALS